MKKVVKAAKNSSQSAADCVAKLRSRISELSKVADKFDILLSTHSESSELVESIEDSAIYMQDKVDEILSTYYKTMYTSNTDK